MGTAGAAETRGAKARAKNSEPLSHDTVAVLVGDERGRLAGACSTSGLSHKLPGRVGDSPLIGIGLYVDDAAGAAAATGVGEEIIRAGGVALIVELMRQGRTPQEACEAMIARINDVAKRRGVRPAEVGVLALNPQGEIGAACTEPRNSPTRSAVPAECRCEGRKWDTKCEALARPWRKNVSPLLPQRGF